MTEQDVIAQLQSLTSRQREILTLFCEGNTYKEIGKALFITTNAVKSHMANIYIKLGLVYVTSSLRRKILFETYCPALHERKFVPREDEPLEPEPAPDEVIEIVEKDERALVVIEPITIHIPENDKDQKEEPEEKQDDEEKTPKEKPKKGKKKKRLWRIPLIVILLALVVFGGLQVYTWAQGFLNDVVAPMIAQATPEMASVEDHQESKNTAKPIATTKAPAQAAAVPTSTSRPQPTAPPQPKSLFSDNFNAGLSSGWQVVYGNPIVVNGVLSTDQETLLIVGDTNWKDYAVEFDADAADCWFSWSDNWLGVRSSNTDNMYAYKWSDCESYWYTVKGGSWNEIPQSKFSPGYETLKFKIQVQGGNLSVYVDGMLMSSFYDNSHTQGRVALKIAKNTVIDNFVIKELD